MLLRKNFSEKRFKKCLKTRFIGRKTVYKSVCKSTNLLAKAMYDMPDGTVFAASRQTNGRGRLGREWASDTGGIFMSVLLKPDIDAVCVAQITLVAAIAVCRAIGENAQIKWPNDVVINSRKVCGILTELSAVSDGTPFIVCGIGINANEKSFPAELEFASSLRLQTQRTWDCSRLAANVINELESALDVFAKHGFSALADEYKALSINLNRDVRLIYENRQVTGTVVDILPNGELAVKTDNGVIAVKSGEVSVRGLYGYV